MSNLESLAQLWDLTTSSSRLADYELSQFNFTGDNARKSISDIWLGLYGTIAQTNILIKNLAEKGSVIADTSKRSVLKGEAYAMRAFCHFDLLRLFGQLPQNSTIKVSLPYAEVVSTSELPRYYDFDQFVLKIESDLNKAEKALFQTDPIFTETFTELNTIASGNEDDFMRFRQNRFNYWAVRALQARFYLYIGNTAKAYEIAKSILTANGPDGNRLISLSGISDTQQEFLGMPTESLMMLNVHNIMDYSPSVLATGTERVLNSHLVQTTSRLATLFTGQNPTTNNRNTKVWGRLTALSGTNYAVLRKYYHNSAQTGVTGPVNLTKRQIIPLIRLSEMYLIVMETTNDLNEANTLWQQYMLSHEVQITNNTYPSLAAVKNGVVAEYSREFYGEGQLFYTYKRTNATSMLFRTGAITEANYVLPLPLTEFNPN